MLTITSVAWLGEPHGTLTLWPQTVQFVPHTPMIPGTIIFQVTIADTRGASVTGDVSVTIRGRGSNGGTPGSHKPPRLTMQSGGRAGISFQGDPGSTYLIQRSVDMPGWHDHDLETVTTDASGLIQHIDSSPPKLGAYYRIAIP
jgi:hypothetical protein